jgi:hypothetical protein
VPALPLKRCSSLVPALGINDDQSAHLARRLPERQCGHARLLPLLDQGSSPHGSLPALEAAAVVVNSGVAARMRTLCLGGRLPVIPAGLLAQNEHHRR